MDGQCTRSLEALTRYTTLVLLLVTAVANAYAGLTATLLSSRNKNDNVESTQKHVEWRQANLWSMVVCLIAFGFYVKLHCNDDCALTESSIRSMDWLITCPLLLFEMGAILMVPLFDTRLWAIAVASVLMNLIGWGAKPTTICLLSGFAFLAFIAGVLANIMQNEKNSKRRRNVVTIFFALWALYGVVAALSSSDNVTSIWASNAFNILDCGSKAIFGLTIVTMTLL